MEVTEYFLKNNLAVNFESKIKIMLRINKFVGSKCIVL